jgi:hypothetical protein
LPEYQVVRDNEAYHEQVNQANSQLGDPAKGAAGLIRLAAGPNPPVHLLLGEDAYGMAEAKIKHLQEDMAHWKDLSFSTAAEPAHA